MIMSTAGGIQLMYMYLITFLNIAFVSVDFVMFNKLHVLGFFLLFSKKYRYTYNLIKIRTSIRCGVYDIRNMYLLIEWYFIFLYFCFFRYVIKKNEQNTEGGVTDDR